MVIAPVTFEVQGNETLGLRRSTLCQLSWEAALRLLRWFYLSQWWLLGSQSADNIAPIGVAGYGYYLVHAMPKVVSTNSPNRNSSLDKILPNRYVLFISFWQLIFHYICKNAPSVVYRFTH